MMAACITPADADAIAVVALLIGAGFGALAMIGVKIFRSAKP